MAQCCQVMGRAYEQSDDELTKQWYARAAGWYEKAKAAYPDDFSIVRRLTSFYLQTKQIAEAEAQLNAILKEGAKPQSADRVAWARRTLALVLSTDRQRVHDALALLKNVGSQITTGVQGAVAFEDPEDVRVLARVLGCAKNRCGPQAGDRDSGIIDRKELGERRRSFSSRSPLRIKWRLAQSPRSVSSS